MMDKDPRKPVHYPEEQEEILDGCAPPKSGTYTFQAPYGGLLPLTKRILYKIMSRRGAQ